MDLTLQKQALKSTQWVVERWCALDVTAVRDCLDERASWIGRKTGELFLGRDRIIPALEQELNGLQLRRITAQSYQIADSGEDWCLVTGGVVVAVREPSVLPDRTVRLSFLWKLRGNELRLSHMHLSDAPAGMPDDGCGGRGAVTVMASDRTRRVFFREDVTYLSADNEYMLIHCRKGDIRLHRRLGAVQAELFPGFLQIHRCYYINPSCLRALRRYEAELLDGTKLNVSRKRYAPLRKKLELL